MILVDIYIPSLDETYNFKLDETAVIKQIIQEVSEMICKKFKTELNRPADTFYLCSEEQSVVLDSSTTLSENNIHNGSKMFLV